MNARLRAEYRIDTIGAWLCDHHCVWAAELLWKACRML